MRLQLAILSLITLLSSLVAGDTAEKWTEIALKSKSGVINLNDKTFDQIISADRNYTTIVCLTALAPQYQCAFCREFEPEFNAVAKSWKRAHPDLNNVFFARLDFGEGRPIFMRFGIQSAPNVWVYPPTVGPLSKLTQNNQPIVYDFPGSGMNADPFVKFLQTTIKLPPFQLVRDFNWQKLFVTLSTVTFLGILFKLAWPQVQKIVMNKNTWAVLSLVTILMFTSGHMFNTIRHTPYAQPNGRGGFNYIAGGFQNQFGVETQIIAAIYGLLAFTTMALVLKAPTIENPTSQTIVVLIWSGGIMFVYSFLIYIFRVKNGGYPFKLFL